MEKRGILAYAGLVIALVSAIAAVSSGPGSRAGLWDFRTGFSILRWAAEGGLLAFLLSVAGIAVYARKRKPRPLAQYIGVVLGLAVFFIPLRWWYMAVTLPPIHDITTDTDDPPQFVAILPLRKDAPNPASYGGAMVAEMQRAAYPDIRPVVLRVGPEVAFKKVLVAIRKMEWWSIVADAREEGRIEATDTTFWYGFKDDIVIRVRPHNDGSVVDVRSASRVGVSDVGTNARRVRKFLRLLEGS